MRARTAIVRLIEHARLVGILIREGSSRTGLRLPHAEMKQLPYSPDQGRSLRRRFTSTEVVYGVTGTDVTELPEYGVSP